MDAKWDAQATPGKLVDPSSSSNDPPTTFAIFVDPKEQDFNSSFERRSKALVLQSSTRPTTMVILQTLMWPNRSR
eukprot:scaffold89_cov318-Pavlova_lutheri.AAC.15